MLVIKVGGQEIWDTVKEEFGVIDPITLELEHSLAAISKWEEKYKRPFLSRNKGLTVEELIYHVRCMTINKVPDSAYDVKNFSQDIINEIQEYMNDSHTATWFSDNENKSPNNQIITAEIVYFWMIDHGIPFECQYWHFQKLMTLIRVCQEKRKTQNGKDKKRLSPQELMERNRKLNKERRARLNSKG